MTNTVNMTVTEAAREKFREALDGENLGDHAVRIAVEQVTPVKLRYRLAFAAPESKRPEDSEVVAGDVRVWVDPESAKLLEGAKVDYVKALSGNGFKFENPNEPEGWTDPVAAKLQELLDNEINPGLAAHGGYVSLLDYKDGKAYVSMGGGCQGCGMASATMSQGIEARVMEVLPEVKEIIDVTDHAGGSNPYY